MIVKVSPSSLHGSVRAPRSKSDMQRACAAALLHKGKTIILDPGRSNDDNAALDVIAKLGARIQDEGNRITIESEGVNPVTEELNCGESGLGIRMFTPIAAGSGKSITISGRGSLVNRPMDFFDEIFPQLGIQISSNAGKLPLQIQGPLKPKSIEVDGSLSSQFLTGLLMAFSAAGASDVSIKVRSLKSKPYIDMTLAVLKAFGMKVPNHQYHEEFTFDTSPIQVPPQTIEYPIEGDWSGAAFLFVAGALAGPIEVLGMNPNSVQADMKILEAIRDSGAGLTYNNETYRIEPSSLQSFQFDATECPDLFPPLVALASCCKGTTVIKGAGRLTHKESNRALTLQDVFGKMGIKIDLIEDEMHVHGGKLIGARVHSHHDHRIAMAAAVAALRADGEVVIEEAEAINKSYPDFYQHIKILGTRIEEI